MAPFQAIQLHWVKIGRAAETQSDNPLNEYCIHDPLDTVNPATQRGPLVAMALHDVIPETVTTVHVIPL